MFGSEGIGLILCLGGLGYRFVFGKVYVEEASEASEVSGR